ncbi:MAG: hypothetical protein ABJ215_14475 [Alphaproteobacteria bacterium]
MPIILLRGARAVVMAGFVVCAAAFVGLSIYAALQFGLWWPGLVGLEGSTRLILAAVTMLPFLLLFTRLNWSRPLGWLSQRFNRVVEPIDRAIAKRSTS